MCPHRNTQQYMIISSPVEKASQDRKRNLTGPDATSNPKSLDKLGMASHPGPTLVCYNCFHILAAEARSYHHGDTTLLCFISNLQKISYSGWQGCNSFHWFFSPHKKDRLLFLLILRSNFQYVQGKQLQNAAGHSSSLWALFLHNAKT